MNGIQINIDTDNVVIAKEYDKDQEIIIDREFSNVKKFVWEGPMRETGKILLMATKLIEMINEEVQE